MNACGFEFRHGSVDRRPRFLSKIVAQLSCVCVCVCACVCVCVYVCGTEKDTTSK